MIPFLAERDREEGSKKGNKKDAKRLGDLRKITVDRSVLDGIPRPGASSVFFSFLF